MSLRKHEDVNEVAVPELVKMLYGKCTTISATREFMQPSNYIIMCL